MGTSTRVTFPILILLLLGISATTQPASAQDTQDDAGNGNDAPRYGPDFHQLDQ